MWPDADETRNLLQRAAANDAGAVEQLWESYRAPLRRMIALRLDQVLGRRLDASDVVQDVLIKANLRLGDYLRNPVLPFDLWLRQLARDQMIDAHRRHRGAARRSLDREQSLAAPAPSAFLDRSTLDLAAQLRDPALTPAAAVLRSELQRRFQAALGQLDDPDREIILLRHFEQLSNGAAAQTLGLSEAAAGMRHLRALRRLRALLGDSPSASKG
jgi:RNA polymerase sigma-70 factor (ECF subfamily)